MEEKYHRVSRQAGFTSEQPRHVYLCTSLENKIQEWLLGYVSQLWATSHNTLNKQYNEYQFVDYSIQTRTDRDFVVVQGEGNLTVGNALQTRAQRMPTAYRIIHFKTYIVVCFIVSPCFLLHVSTGSCNFNSSWRSGDTKCSVGYSSLQNNPLQPRVTRDWLEPITVPNLPFRPIGFRFNLLFLLFSPCLNQWLVVDTAEISLFGIHDYMREDSSFPTRPRKAYKTQRLQINTVRNKRKNTTNQAKNHKRKSTKCNKITI